MCFEVQGLLIEIYFQRFNQERDGGEYQCLVRNDAGWTLNHEANPYLLKPFCKSYAVFNTLDL